jgi:hypothetical protein
MSSVLQSLHRGTGILTRFAIFTTETQRHRDTETGHRVHPPELPTDHTGKHRTKHHEKPQITQIHADEISLYSTNGEVPGRQTAGTAEYETEYER